MRSFIIRTGWPRESRYLVGCRPGKAPRWTADLAKAKRWKVNRHAFSFARTYFGAHHSAEVEVIPLPCPDGGTCHHQCEDDYCFRVNCCGPLSGVYPNDEWPTEIEVAFKAVRP